MLPVLAPAWDAMEGRGRGVVGGEKEKTRIRNAVTGISR